MTSKPFFFSWFPLFCNVCKTEQDAKPKLLEFKRWMKRTETTAAKTKNKSNKDNKVLHVFPAGSLFIRATVLVLMWYIGKSHGYSGWVIIPRPTFSARNLYWTVLFARLPAVHGKGGTNMLEKSSRTWKFWRASDCISLGEDEIILPPLKFSRLWSNFSWFWTIFCLNFWSGLRWVWNVGVHSATCLWCEPKVGITGQMEPIRSHDLGRWMRRFLASRIV